MKRNDLPAAQPTSSMSAPGNVTSVSADIVTSAEAATSSSSKLLWIPYVLIALLFIVFLGANFWCYHRRHRERYLRKRDENRMKDGLHERRRITALMRSHFQSAFLSKNNSMEEQWEQSNDLKGPCPATPVASYGPVSVRLSPGQPAVGESSSSWTGQYGSCAATAATITTDGVGSGGEIGDVSCTDHLLDNNNGSVVH